jgi:holo-[acyl-carrier protein] synthase
MIRGVGIDAVPIERMRLALRRTPGLAQRVFTSHELETSASRASLEASLAARFAAKEACRKALAEVIPWRDVEVVSDDDRVPTLRVAGYESLRFHLSLTHTDDLALAVVLAEA